MSDLVPVSALGGTQYLSRRLGALELTENGGLALASLALSRGAEQPLPYGLPLPEPGRWIAGRGVAAFWTGPGQWMVEADGRAEEDFARDLRSHAPGCYVTEQTDGWSAIEIASSAGEAPLLALLEKLANVDLAAFGPGSATRTELEHMSVFLIRRDTDRIAILGMRSSAGSLWHAVETAAERVEALAV